MQTRSYIFLLIMSADVALSQKDCTGVTCPVLQNCIESVLEDGACCPKCTQRGCTCEGYQYYDCEQKGFKDGKIPEGESYFVDFGSTKCSCPQGGGNISCLYIVCPEISPNCIDVLQPADGCPVCGRVGCAHGNKKYEAGHSFELDKCQVCHCPYEGGMLTCSPIPGCDLHGVNNPMWATTTENNSHLRDISGGHDTRSTSLFSKVGLANALPLYKEDPPSFGSEDYDYILAEPTSSTIRNLAKSQDAATVPSTHPESSSATFTSHDVRGNDLLVKTCCETGEKWASANGHCIVFHVHPLSVRTAQQQCCLGSLKERQCLAGIEAARAGSFCREDASSKCGTDSYKECCSCCFLGLQFHRAGHRCEAHQYLGLHCRHVFLNCCKQAEGTQTVRDRPALDPTLPPVKETEQQVFRAFSIGEERDGENAVEGPVEDRDECLNYGSNICNQRCVNTPGSFRCECYPGYVLQEDASTCARGERPQVVQRCTPVGGRPQCSCSLGFSLRADGRSCDGNEQKCHNNAESISIWKSVVTEVNNRLKITPYRDVDECLSAHGCQLNERCVNTRGSYVCQRLITCPPGYQISNDVCEDIDECMMGNHNCGDGLVCLNTAGSFRCNPKPVCPAGYKQDVLLNCIDIDECTTLTQPCSSGFTCVNTAGSYICNRKITCSRGYHASPEGSRCVGKICSHLHRMHESSVLIYRSKVNLSRADLSRRNTYINECWRYPGRLCAQTCENTPGSYECSCTSGFRLSADGKSCEDVNECLTSQCSQECANIYGSYQCYCRKGYYLREDRHTCEDIDECSQSIGHLCAYRCVNTPGDYQCACPEYGYAMSPNGRSCRDIDECATGTHNCSLGEKCYNIQGGYRCLSLNCPPNYRKVSDTRCERISCPNYLQCQNSPQRITYYYLSFQSNIVIPAQIFRIGPAPAYSGDNVIVTITEGNEESYFSTRKLNAYTGAVFLQRQVQSPRDFLITVEMKLWRQGKFATFQARLYIFITPNLL
uniref:Fibulin 2 n=1 Tax=Poecilia reticulata TaxID=8081 RepID=A0A3P9NVH8_POERE